MEMPHNAFKRAIRDGKSQIGLWSSLSSNYTVEVIAGAGFDWILLDTEHSPNDLESVLQQAQAAAAYPVSTLARVPWNDMVTIKRFLDIGIQTLLIPYVCSVAEAKDAVRFTRYPPAGVRGVAGSTRATRFGRVKDYAKHAQEEICVLVQVETKGALDQLEDICAVDGVDGVFIGPADLHASMGYTGEINNPERRADDRGGDAPHPQVRQGARRAGVRGARHPPLHRRRRAVHGGRRRCGHPRPRRRGALRQVQGLSFAARARGEYGMAEGDEKVQIHRGLQGVHFDRSRVCFIDGRAGELLYRGYSIHDLAERSTFEETCYLLLKGELPTRAELDAFAAELKAARSLPAGILDIVRTVQGRASDGRAAHRRVRARRLRSRRRRQFAGGHAAEGRAPHVAGADDRRGARGHPPRPRGSRARPAPFARRQFPADADRQGAERRPPRA